MISELPDARLAILEGYNGIGKTLAIRILELCTGSMPYAVSSPPWESLRDGLGHIEVEISGLQGARNVKWTADSADWTMGDGPAPRDDWFKSILIDDAPVLLDDVRRLVTVTRLAGDEDLTQTFAAEADTRAAVVHRWAAKHADSEQGPLKRLEDLAGTADELLASPSVAELAQLDSEADAANQELAQSRAAVGRLQDRRSSIKEALELRRRIGEMLANEPALQAELSEIDDQIRQRREELEAAQEEVTRLAAQAGRSQELERELTNAERTLRRNIRNLADASRGAAAQAAALDIEPNRQSTKRHFEDLAELERQLEDQHRDQYQAPAMMQLLDTLSDELVGAESRGLGDQIALEDAGSGTQLSVSRTRAGMVARYDFLQQQPPPPRAIEILQELERVKERKARVNSLLKTHNDVERFERLVNSNEDRVRSALRRGAGGEAAEALESANTRRFECNQALLDLATRRAAIAQRLGTSDSVTSQQALSGQLDSILRQLGLSEERLDSESLQIEQSLSEIEAELAEANSTARTCRQLLAQQRATIRNAVERLRDDPDLAWVRNAVSRTSPTASASLGQLHQYLAVAQEITRAVVERLGKHRIELEAVEAALQGTARQLRGQPVNATVYVEQIQAWLASLFSAWFNDPRVRRELLKSADEGQEISVDLGSRRVSWSENQVKRSRPLEAFSSGEQAFAYTRARLALLDDPDLPVRNQLIVLDEFGAFIAQHLLRGMLEYLKEWTEAREGVRVLLVLPLSRDYAQMARTAIGERAKRYDALARNVDERGYATRTIVR
ncbi:MAG: hypothetical protein OXI97_18435 [Acidimicrobiaceae bacterium]|nr:hypothetical protein [Acidimicrobiaceae bacterium]